MASIRRHLYHLHWRWCVVHCCGQSSIYDVAGTAISQIQIPPDYHLAGYASSSIELFWARVLEIAGPRTSVFLEEIVVDVCLAMEERGDVVSGIEVEVGDSGFSVHEGLGLHFAQVFDMCS